MYEQSIEYFESVLITRGCLLVGAVSRTREIACEGGNVRRRDLKDGWNVQ
jgi:hypothetical protein